MVPGLSPDEPGSAKELVYGISSPYSSGEAISVDSLPTPTWNEAGRTPANPPQQTARLNLLAVYAIRVMVDDVGEVEKLDGPMVIDSDGGVTYGDAVVDITQKAKDKTAYTPPGDAKIGKSWVVVAVYYRGTLQVRLPTPLSLTIWLTEASSVQVTLRTECRYLHSRPRTCRRPSVGGWRRRLGRK